MTSVLQEWVEDLPMMQQTVLLTAVRGPDGLPKYHATKWLLRWYRRCTLLSALDGRVLSDPIERNAGSFTGPTIVAADPAWAATATPADWEPLLDLRVDDYGSAGEGPGGPAPDWTHGPAERRRRPARLAVVEVSRVPR